MNKKPVELHLIDGTKTDLKRVLVPEQLKSRVPTATWLDNPDAWDRAKFMTETADFLFEVYGIGTDQDKHTLSILADHIETYVACVKNIRSGGIITKFPNNTVGPNPFINVRHKVTSLIIQLMNEMGLTPRSRLASGKISEDTPAKRFKAGPKG